MKLEIKIIPLLSHREAGSCLINYNFKCGIEFFSKIQ